MINFDEKFWLAIAFAIFVTLIIKFVKPIISKALADKSDAIAKEINDAKELKEKATKLLSDAEKYCAESKKYAEKLIQDAEAEAQKFSEESRKMIEKEISKRTAASIERIKTEEELVIRKIKNDIISSTIQNLTQNLAKEMNDDQQNHLVTKAAKDFEKFTN